MGLFSGHKNDNRPNLWPQMEISSASAKAKLAQKCFGEIEPFS
jgi:hypothetical protein